MRTHQFSLPQLIPWGGMKQGAGYTQIVRGRIHLDLITEKLFSGPEAWRADHTHCTPSLWPVNERGMRRAVSYPEYLPIVEASIFDNGRASRPGRPQRG